MISARVIVPSVLAIRRRRDTRPATPINATAPGAGTGKKSNVKGTLDVVCVGEPGLVRFCCWTVVPVLLFKMVYVAKKDNLIEFEVPR